MDSTPLSDGRDPAEVVVEQARAKYEHMHECFWDVNSIQNIVRQMLDERDDLRDQNPKASEVVAHFAQLLIKSETPAPGNALKIREALQWVDRFFSYDGSGTSTDAATLAIEATRPCSSSRARSPSTRRPATATSTRTATPRGRRTTRSTSASACPVSTTGSSRRRSRKGARGEANGKSHLSARSDLLRHRKRKFRGDSAIVGDAFALLLLRLLQPRLQDSAPAQTPKLRARLRTVRENTILSKQKTERSRTMIPTPHEIVQEDENRWYVLDSNTTSSRLRSTRRRPRIGRARCSPKTRPKSAARKERHRTASDLRHALRQVRKDDLGDLLETRK